MGKKKKNKFKKKFNLQPNAQSIPSTSELTTNLEVSGSERKFIRETSKSQEPITEEKYAYVRKDIRRDFLIILGLLLILAIATYLNSTTSYLSSVSDWIYKTLNLSV